LLLVPGPAAGGHAGQLHCCAARYSAHRLQGQGANQVYRLLLPGCEGDPSTDVTHMHAHAHARTLTNTNLLLCLLPHHSANNAPLSGHLEAEGVDFLQFAFRWVNCLLVREVPYGAALRLWDTYLAEGGRLPDFLVRLGCRMAAAGATYAVGATVGEHPCAAPYATLTKQLNSSCMCCVCVCVRARVQVYVCASFLACWQPAILGREFQELLMFLQRLPTADWGDDQVESVLSHAYVLRNTWGSAHSARQT
jgi:Rab-GTPase-TBC domain